MSKRWAIVFVFLLTPILTELLTSNTPLNHFLNPLVLFSLVITYGLPLLVIREFAIRWKLGLGGILLLGIAYGILNEGVIAGTLVHATNLPIGSFENYIRIGGINVGWATYILFWHALHSVLFPLLLVEFFRNDWDSWLGDRAFKFSVWFLLLGSLFVVIIVKSGTVLFLALLMIALVFLAKRFHRQRLASPQTGGVGIVFMGFFSIVYAITLFVSAQHKVSPVIFLLIAIAVPYLVFKYLAKKGFLSHRGLLLFGLGSYIAYACFAMLLGSPTIILTNIVLVILLAWMASKVIKNLTSSSLQI
jgi:hypothetical protein